MKRLIIITDEDSEFFVSKPDSKNFTSMDVDKIKNYFITKNFNVSVFKFSELDLSQDYCGSLYVISNLRSRWKFL